MGRMGRSVLGTGKRAILIKPADTVSTQVAAYAALQISTITTSFIACSSMLEAHTFTQDVPSYLHTSHHPTCSTQLNLKEEAMEPRRGVTMLAPAGGRKERSPWHAYFGVPTPRNAYNAGSFAYLVLYLSHLRLLLGLVV
jgi:hypothetical protein